MGCRIRTKSVSGTGLVGNYPLPQPLGKWEVADGEGAALAGNGQGVQLQVWYNGHVSGSIVGHPLSIWVPPERKSQARADPGGGYTFGG